MPGQYGQYTWGYNHPEVDRLCVCRVYILWPKANAGRKQAWSVRYSNVLPQSSLRGNAPMRLRVSCSARVRLTGPARVINVHGQSEQSDGKLHKHLMEEPAVTLRCASGADAGHGKATAEGCLTLQSTECLDPAGDKGAGQPRCTRSMRKGGLGRPLKHLTMSSRNPHRAVLSQKDFSMACWSPSDGCECTHRGSRYPYFSIRIQRFLDQKPQISGTRDPLG